MLYPNFHDLVALKNRRSALKHRSNRSVRSIVPGNHHSPFRGQGLEFDSVREYVFGDDIRNIDWRVTARTGSPHLKIFKEDRERHIILCVDMNHSMRFGTKNTFKSVQAARIASLLGWQGISQQDRVSACLFGDVPGRMQFFAPKRTGKSFCAMLKMLAEPTTDQHQVPFVDVWQHISRTAHTGSLVYFISDFLDLKNDVQVHLNRLNKRCDVIFIAINDPADKSIYPVGALGFSAQSREKIYVNTDSIAGREAYEAQWMENRKRLYELTSRLKIPLIELATESDIPRDLPIALKTIGKRKMR